MLSPVYTEPLLQQDALQNNIEFAVFEPKVRLPNLRQQGYIQGCIQGGQSLSSPTEPVFASLDVCRLSDGSLHADSAARLCADQRGILSQSQFSCLFCIGLGLKHMSMSEYVEG